MTMTDTHSTATTSALPTLTPPTLNEIVKGCAAWRVPNDFKSMKKGEETFCAIDFYDLTTPREKAKQDRSWLIEHEAVSCEFCARLIDQDFTIRPGDPDGKLSPGGCSVFHRIDGFHTDMEDYGVTLAVAYDPQGCATNDHFPDGMSMRKWGTDNCVGAFNTLLGACSLDSGKQRSMLNIGDYNSIRGIVFKNCMHLQMAAVRSDVRPWDTFDYDGVPPSPEGWRELSHGNMKRGKGCAQ
jgi:hypothetical protein